MKKILKPTQLLYPNQHKYIQVFKKVSLKNLNETLNRTASRTNKIPYHQTHPQIPLQKIHLRKKEIHLFLKSRTRLIN